MKYNKNNFPVKSTPQAYEKWGKGFEAELREISTKTRILEKEPIISIKEILGE